MVAISSNTATCDPESRDYGKLAAATTLVTAEELRWIHSTLDRNR